MASTPPLARCTVRAHATSRGVYAEQTSTTQIAELKEIFSATWEYPAATYDALFTAFDNCGLPMNGENLISPECLEHVIDTGKPIITAFALRQVVKKVQTVSGVDMASVLHALSRS